MLAESAVVLDKKRNKLSRLAMSQEEARDTFTCLAFSGVALWVGGGRIGAKARPAEK